MSRYAMESARPFWVMVAASVILTRLGRWLQTVDDARVEL